MVGSECGLVYGGCGYAVVAITWKLLTPKNYCDWTFGIWDDRVLLPLGCAGKLPAAQQTGIKDTRASTEGQEHSEDGLRRGLCGLTVKVIQFKNLCFQIYVAV